jgi:hypothetical protein
MCSFCTGKLSNWRRLNRWSRFSELNIDALVTQEFHHLSPMKAPLPISPQNGMRSVKWRRERSDYLSFVEWPEHSADAARSLGERRAPGSVVVSLCDDWKGGPPYQGGCVLFPGKEAQFYPSLLLATTSLRNAWVTGEPRATDQSPQRAKAPTR